MVSGRPFVLSDDPRMTLEPRTLVAGGIRIIPLWNLFERGGENEKLKITFCSFVFILLNRYSVHAHYTKYFGVSHFHAEQDVSKQYLITLLYSLELNSG